MERLGTNRESKKEMEHQKAAKRNRLMEFLGKKDNIILIILGGILLMVIAIPSNVKSNNSIFTSDLFATNKTGSNAIDNLYETRQAEGTATKYQSSLLASLQEKHNGYATGLELRLENLLLQIEGCQNVYVMITFAMDEMGNCKDYDYCYHYPEIDGVVVVMQADDFNLMEEKITYMIQSLFSLDAHKIRVINMKTK